MLLMVEKGIIGGICHSIYRYAKANNKYMKDYDKNKKSSYIQYWDVNNLYGWAISQKLPVNNFEWIKDTSQLNEDFAKNYKEESDEGYLLAVDVQYLEKLHELHNNLPFLPERMKTKKVEKLVANLQDKTEYVIHKENLKQALNHGLVLKKVHGVIKFTQNAWLKPYIDMNTDLRKKAKNDFEKYFLKLMNNAVFGKIMENVRKHRDIKLVTTKRKRDYLVSEPNYHTTKFFTKHLLAIEMKKKTEVLMNKPVYLGLSILELSKILMNQFSYDYVKPKFGKKSKLCYMDKDCFNVYIKTDDIYKYIAEDVETRFDTSNYGLESNSIERPLPKGKNKKVIGLMKDELGRKIMTKLVGLRAKACCYLIHDGSEDKKGKGTKKCVIKRKLKFENYKNCLEATQLEKNK